MDMLNLSDRQDECLRLYWGDNHPTQERIARRLGITQQRVSRHIQNARRKLEHGVGNKEIPTDPVVLDRLGPGQIRAVV